MVKANVRFVSPQRETIGMKDRTFPSEVAALRHILDVTAITTSRVGGGMPAGMTMHVTIEAPAQGDTDWPPRADGEKKEQAP